MSELKTILYVDDEQVNTYLFELNLRKRFKVLTGQSGFEGLKILSENSDVCVVISDMKMPGMNGIEFIKKAREHRPDIEYYIITGYDITPEIEEALNSSLIHRYYCKPFNFKEIESAINHNHS